MLKSLFCPPGAARGLSSLVSFLADALSALSTLCLSDLLLVCPSSNLLAAFSLPPRIPHFRGRSLSSLSSLRSPISAWCRARALPLLSPSADSGCVLPTYWSRFLSFPPPVRTLWPHSLVPLVFPPLLFRSRAGALPVNAAADALPLLHSSYRSLFLSSPSPRTLWPRSRFPLPSRFRPSAARGRSRSSSFVAGALASLSLPRFSYSLRMAVPCRLLRGLLRGGGFTGVPGLVGPWRSRCYTRVAGPEEAEEGGREGEMGREGEEGSSLRVLPPELPRGKWEGPYGAGGGGRSWIPG